MNVKNEHKPDEFRGLSRDELFLKLRDAVADSKEPENDEAVEALEDAILASERERPSGFIPDSGGDFRELLERLTQSNRTRRRLPHAVTAIFRYGVAAVLAVAVTMGGMMTAEARGLNVFGTLSQFARGERVDKATGALTETLDEGNTVRISGLSMTPADGSMTLAHFREDEPVDYAVTVENLSAGDTSLRDTPVYFHLLVDGTMAQEMPATGPCTFIFHGKAGNCLITAIANGSMELSVTVRRIPTGGDAG